jgi:Protein of unknown function (DUF3048) N-terminal domain/Protein of unknown function (DUF3048) C-terminal domain
MRMSRMRRARPVARRAVAVLAAGVLVLTGCSKHAAPAAAPTPPPPTTPPPTTSAAPSRPAPKPPVTNPLTGRPGMPRGPVLAVKIDNTSAGRPQIGLDAADVVYVEQVEGGATRLVAVYASRYPARVGPVRSVRNGDPELLSAYGRAGLVFSGGAGRPLATLHHSVLRDLSGAGGYSRDGSRHAPYNLVNALSVLAGRLPAVVRARDVGFRWSDTDPRLAGARHVLRMTALVGRVGVSFGFDPRTHRWVETIGGRHVRAASGAEISTPNVIVQFCPVTVDHTDVDVLGSPSAYTHTVGRGPVVIFRDGRAITGTWVRAKAGGITRYLDRSGKDITLRTGGAWVLLAATGSPLRYG